MAMISEPWSLSSFIIFWPEARNSHLEWLLFKQISLNIIVTEALDHAKLWDFLMKGNIKKS